ncbi:MAG: hypothetical protein EAZ53_09005 [Bacteroidetes bacterium]|nr:MAG: hypothetical protein EAZ53_09005 [Bacteroidota bacterium]
MINSLFITNPKDLNSDILGGVQICSQEFLEVVKLVSNKFVIHNVNISQNLFLKAKRKLKIDSYDLYDIEPDKNEILSIINKHEINYIFINKAELIKFSKIIKLTSPYSVKVVLMSHGNETGDFLHELTHIHSKFSLFKKSWQKLRLGLNLFLESYYRHRYIDLVCAMSEEEVAIEKWLGSKEIFFFPRLIRVC